MSELAVVLDLSSLIRLEALAEVYAQQVERVEFVKAIASGTPASEAYHKIRHRRVNIA